MNEWCGQHMALLELFMSVIFSEGELLCHKLDHISC